MRKIILLSSIICLIPFIFTCCATLRLEPIKIEDKKNNIAIKVEYDPEFIDFTAFKVTLRNNQSKPIYFQPLNCTIEVLDKEPQKVYSPCTYRKVIKKDKWEVEHLPSYQKEEKEISAPSDYYFGDVGIYYYEMEKIKSLLFEEDFILPTEEKSGYIFFPYFKEGTKLKLKIPIQDINFEFIYMIKSMGKSKIERIFEEIFFYE